MHLYSAAAVSRGNGRRLNTLVHERPSLDSANPSRLGQRPATTRTKAAASKRLRVTSVILGILLRRVVPFAAIRGGIAEEKP